MLSTGLNEGVETGQRAEMKTLSVVAGLIIEQGRVLMTQRREDSLHGLLWEFPGGKMEEGEEPRQALKRELEEELGIEAEVGRLFEATFHLYPEFPLLLLVYHCRIVRGVAKPLKARDLRWVNLQQMKELTLPPADEPIRKNLCSSEEVRLL
jgi:8-oxo-dGTP diphosphatase